MYYLPRKFDTAPQAARATAMSLPDPQASARADERRPRHEQTWQEWLERELARAARKFLRDLLRSFF